MEPTKITIRCEADSPRGIWVRAYRAAEGAPYFDTHVAPGNQAEFDQHHDIFIEIQD